MYRVVHCAYRVVHYTNRVVHKQGGPLYRVVHLGLHNRLQQASQD
jgi:hypothetical protein